MIKIVLTKHFVSYPKREKWKESSSLYSSMSRIMNQIEFKPSWKLKRIITVAYPKNHYYDFQNITFITNQNMRFPKDKEVNQVLESQ